MKLCTAFVVPGKWRFSIRIIKEAVEISFPTLWITVGENKFCGNERRFLYDAQIEKRRSRIGQRGDKGSNQAHHQPKRDRDCEIIGKWNLVLDFMERHKRDRNKGPINSIRSVIHGSFSFYPFRCQWLNKERKRRRRGFHQNSVREKVSKEKKSAIISPPTKWVAGSDDEGRCCWCYWLRSAS